MSYHILPCTTDVEMRKAALSGFVAELRSCRTPVRCLISTSDCKQVVGLLGILRDLVMDEPEFFYYGMDPLVWVTPMTAQFFDEFEVTFSFLRDGMPVLTTRMLGRGSVGVKKYLNGVPKDHESVTGST